MSPLRSKASDGTIGNAEHAARESDHNPNSAGIVCAMDITNDPDHGIDSEKLANALLASRDPRIKYVISNRKIASGRLGPSPWVWRPYRGANPHNHHMHISVLDVAGFVDSQDNWDFHMDTSQSTKTPATSHEISKKPKIALGSKDEVAVKELQRLLNLHGTIPPLREDGDFGDLTDKAVRLFQKTRALVDDGIVGTYTWSALLEPKN